MSNVIKPIAFIVAVTVPALANANVESHQVDEDKVRVTFDAAEASTEMGHSELERQIRRAAKRVAEQKCRRLVLVGEKSNGREQVADVRGKIRVGEIAFALAETREVEAEDRVPGGGQRLADVCGRPQVFRASEAVRKQSIGARWHCR